MNDSQIQAMQACAAGSMSGSLTFPEVVGILAAAGVERYHADYSRQEVTYYLPNGDSHVVAVPHPPAEIRTAFVPEAIVSAIRQSQANEHTYGDFLRKTKAAGCISYFVHIAGRRAIYFGRNGESHVELFPGQTT